MSEENSAGISQPDETLEDDNPVSDANMEEDGKGANSVDDSCTEQDDIEEKKETEDMETADDTSGQETEIFIDVTEKKTPTKTTPTPKARRGGGPMRGQKARRGRRN